MTLSQEINNFFKKYGQYFDYPAINYSKQVVQRIKSSPILDKFFEENDISASVLLNEITPYSNYKYKQFGQESLDIKEVQSILNVILFSNELEKMMEDEHVKFSSIGKFGEIYYVADEYASEYFEEKYGIEIEEGVEFDFSILEEKGDDFDLSGFGIN